MTKYIVNGASFTTIEDAQIYKDSLLTTSIFEVANLFIVRNGFEEHRFTTLSEAEIKRDEILLKDYQVSIQEELNIIDYEANLIKDIDFCKVLINTFLIDNRLHPGSITTNESLALLQKFQVVSALCDKGDIKSVSLLLPNITIDNIYTKERKDKYIQMVTSYINQ